MLCSEGLRCKHLGQVKQPLWLFVPPTTYHMPSRLLLYPSCPSGLAAIAIQQSSIFQLLAENHLIRHDTPASDALTSPVRRMFSREEIIERLLPRRTAIEAIFFLTSMLQKKRA